MNPAIGFYYEDEFIDFWKEYLINQKEYHLELYIHYPWCRSICEFCVFGKLLYSSETKDFIKEYEEATFRMLYKMDKLFNEINVYPDSIYFGGGTASLWSKEFLTNVSNLKCFNSIKTREFEIHPYDLNDNFIDFISKRFHKISIGVQSFDKSSNVHQKRIYVKSDIISKYIKKFQHHGVITNIDLVALFDGVNPKNWEIFIDDLIISMIDIKPDIITVSPNFRWDYYENSIRFREILKNNIPKSDYLIDNDLLNLDHLSILENGVYPYKIYKKGYNNENDYSKDEVVIGIGGYNSMTSTSKTSSYMFSSSYNRDLKEFIFTMYKEIINQSGVNGEIRIGSVTV